MKRGRFRLHPSAQPISRRPGATPGRRFALVLAAALASAGAAAAAAQADTPFVAATIYGTSGVRQDSVSLATLQGDPQTCPEQPGARIEQHGRQGTFTETFNSTTWTMATILECLTKPVKPSDVTAVTIIDGQGAPQEGGNSQLTPSDLGSPSDFQNPGESPLVTLLGSGSAIEYDRPWRGGSDNNFSDQVSEPSGTPIAIEMFEGPALTVTAQASTTSIPTGGSVGFSATVTPSDPSDAFSWSIEGSSPWSTDPAPHMTFTQAGIVNVTVQVIDDKTGSTGSDTIPIAVGQQAQTTTPQTSTTTPTQPTTTPTHTTPGRHGHRGNGNTGGSGKGFGGSGHGPSDKRSHGTGTSKPPSSGSPTTTTSTTPTSTTPSASGSGSGGGSGGSSGSSATAGSGAPSTHTNGHGHAGRSPFQSPLKSPVAGARTANVPLVRGLLVSDVIPLPAASSPLVHLTAASSAPGAPPRKTTSPPVLPVLAAAAAILVLLTLGAARELRGRRDWRALRFGS